MANKPKWTVDSPEVIKRCGDPVPEPSSLICPNCGTPEVFCSKSEPKNQDKWFWAIRAFKVDNYSDCTSCGEWFGS
jgi:hypothetical protein